jgi:hypothetical protein
VLFLSKNTPRTIVDIASTGPKLGRYRFRVQQTPEGDAFFVSYKNGFFGHRYWVKPQKGGREPYYDSEGSWNTALDTFDEALRALEWIRGKIAQYLKATLVSREGHRLRTLVEDR